MPKNCLKYLTVAVFVLVNNITKIYKIALSLFEYILFILIHIFNQFYGIFVE